MYSDHYLVMEISSHFFNILSFSNKAPGLIAQKVYHMIKIFIMFLHLSIYLKIMYMENI